jgi:hypothetical protein
MLTCRNTEMMTLACGGSRGCVVSLMVSVLDAGRCHRRDKPSLLCLVTGTLYRPERRGARRRSVRLTVHDRPGPSATLVQVAVACGRIPAKSQAVSHSVIEKLWEDARYPPIGAARCAVQHDRKFRAELGFWHVR